MPCTKRQKSVTGIYHVTARGINKEHIFNQIRERYYFKKILKKHLEKYDVKIYAYCIMSNHIHIIIHSKIETLSLFMARILAEYAEYYNYKHQRNGHVFQNRFGSECIENALYLWRCIRYIHMNPVNAKMTKSVCAYRFSSMTEYQKEESDIIHQSVFVNYKSCFIDFNDFLLFHQGKDNSAYMDTAEDLQVQRKCAALAILEIMVSEQKVEKALEILEDKNLRSNYLDNLAKSLNISKRQTEKLYKYVESCVFGT